MFEKIVLRRAEDGDTFTLGDLAEALLFYQQVHLILDHGSLKSLIHAIGATELLDLLRNKRITATYCRETLGTKTERQGALEYHSFITFELTGHVHSEKRYTPSTVIEEIFKEEAGCSSRRAAKLTDQFLEFVPVKSLAKSDFLGANSPKLVDAATADVFDAEFMSQAIARILGTWPSLAKYGASAKVETYQNPLGFLVFHGLDLKTINGERSQLTPPQPPISTAHILTDILMARSDVLIAAHYGSDYKTSLGKV